MTASRKIRIGLIGANPKKGWGSSVHIPALRSIDAYELIAVCTSNPESAKASAERFGVKHGFHDPRAMAAHEDVDLVSVCVKAPEHHRLAMIGLEAGKHVFCEWPLAATTAQALEMRAAGKGVKHMVGLQARAAPAIAYAKQMITDGYVGRLISSQLTCSLPGGGGRRSLEGAYVTDRRNGASTMAIHGGHAIDAFLFCVGELAEVSAVVSTQFETVQIIETGETIEKTSPDQVLVSGLLANGAAASIHINGGVVAGFGVSMQFYGTEGALAVTSDSRSNFQMAALALTGARAPDTTLKAIPIPASYGEVEFTRVRDPRAPVSPYPGVDLPSATLANVTRLYEALADAILKNHTASPSFDDGVRIHEVLDAIQKASDTGERQLL